MWEFISNNLSLMKTNWTKTTGRTRCWGRVGSAVHLSANAGGNVDGGDDGGGERETSGRVHPLISY